MVATLFLVIGLSTLWLARCIGEEIHTIALLVTGIILVVWSLFVAAPFLQLSIELGLLIIGIGRVNFLSER